MDHWKFPVGTKLWKEFTRDGMRVETRFIMQAARRRHRAERWFYATYAWNAAQDATTLVAEGRARTRTARSTTSRRAQDCRDCHESLQPAACSGSTRSSSTTTAAPASSISQDLIAQNLLTAPPAGTAAPHFPLPGNAVDQAALGYLHANCGHCHNPTSRRPRRHADGPPAAHGQLGHASPTTPTYTTTVDVDGTVPYTDNGTTFTKIVDRPGPGELGR